MQLTVKLILFWLGLIDLSSIIDNPIDNQEPTFTITDTKLYFPVVTYQLKIMQNC